MEIVAILKMASSLTGNRVFSSLSTKAYQLPELPSLLFGYFSPYLHAPLKWNRSKFTTLHFDVYVHQATTMSLTTGTSNTL